MKNLPDKPKPSPDIIVQAESEGTSTSDSGVLQSSFHMGPLPAPETLAEYSNAFPGLGERIYESFFKEQDERHRNNRTVVTSYTRGQNYAFILIFFGLIVSAALAFYGIDWPSSVGILFLTTLPSLISRITSWLPRSSGKGEQSGSEDTDF